MTEDGSIVINTKIRTDGIKAGTAEIEAGVHRAADRVNTLGSNVKKTLNNQIDSFVKLNDEYSTQEQKVESLPSLDMYSTGIPLLTLRLSICPSNIAPSGTKKSALCP